MRDHGTGQTPAKHMTLSPFEYVCSVGIHRNVARILAARKDLKGKAIIDLACGDGRTTHLLRSLGATATPFDLFPEACKLDDKPQAVDLQAKTSIPDASADMVTLQEVIEHLPNQLLPCRKFIASSSPLGSCS